METFTPSWQDDEDERQIVQVKLENEEVLTIPEEGFNSKDILVKTEAIPPLFPPSKELIIHQDDLSSRIHTGEKTFHKCHICERLYSQKSSLVIHMRVHTGERPYQCDICQKLFTSSSKLKKHFLTMKHFNNLKGWGRQFLTH